MTYPFFLSTISAQSRNNEFLTIKTVVRKTHQNNGHTGSSCLDKAVLAQGGGGVPILSPDDHPNPSQGQEKGFGKKLSFNKFQVPPNSPKNSSVRASGGPMTRAPRQIRGSPWVLEYTYCHQMITENHPRGTRKVPEKVKFSGATKTTKTITISGPSRAPWPRPHGPSGHYVGPHGRSSTRIVTKRPSTPIPMVTKGFQKKSYF